jgi:uncharacterized membrane protein YidH (DUF202 family)
MSKKSIAVIAGIVLVLAGFAALVYNKSQVAVGRTNGSASKTIVIISVIAILVGLTMAVLGIIKKSSAKA